MAQYKAIIPKEFYTYDTNKPVICEDVGQLIDQLNRLPRDLPVQQGFGDVVRLTVFNVSKEDAHLTFREVDS